MTKTMHEVIVEKLKEESLGDRETGWMSDMGVYNLEWDSYNQSISVDGYSGSIDIGHLASIVEDLVINYEH